MNQVQHMISPLTIPPQPMSSLYFGQSLTCEVQKLRMRSGTSHWQVHHNHINPVCLLCTPQPAPACLSVTTNQNVWFQMKEIPMLLMTKITIPSLQNVISNSRYFSILARNKNGTIPAIYNKKWMDPKKHTLFFFGQEHT